MKNVLITGASSGVGKALAIHLSKQYSVIALARRKQVMDKNFKSHDNISSYEVDISDKDTLDRVLDSILEDHGTISYLINNAGVMVAEGLEDLPLETLEQSIHINALAPLDIMKKLIHGMKKDNFGRIINMTSGAPLNCFPGYGAYSASKALLNALTVTFARELESLNIKINLMSPGPVKSEMAPDGPMDASVCFPTVDYLLSDSEGVNTGKFYWLGYEVPLFPDLEGVQWLEGIGNEKLRKIL